MTLLAFLAGLIIGAIAAICLMLDWYPRILPLNFRKTEDSKPDEVKP